LPHDDLLILSFDTSAAQCAAALVYGDRVLAQKSEAMTKGQAERLFPMLEEVLAAGGKIWGDLDRIAVCTGPGNFTGVRISVSAARGLALSLDIPAVGISAFEALAFGSEGNTSVVMDARRGQVYRQEFRDGMAIGVPEREIADEVPEPQVIDPVAVATLAMRALDGVKPSPVYLRPADAALPSDPPPVILP